MRVSPSDPHEAPTFGVQPTPLGVRLLSHRWVLVVLVALFAAVVGLTIAYKVLVEPHLTATRYRLELLGPMKGPTFAVDADAGVVHVSGSQIGPAEFVLVGSRLLLPANVVDPAAASSVWYSFPVSEVLDDPGLFSIARIERATAVGLGYCKLPDAETDALIKATVVQHFEPGDDLHRYDICAGAGSGGDLADGRAVGVDQEAIRPKEVVVPPSDRVVRVEDMGPNGGPALAKARESFRVANEGGAP